MIAHQIGHKFTLCEITIFIESNFSEDAFQIYRQTIV